MCGAKGKPLLNNTEMKSSHIIVNAAFVLPLVLFLPQVNIADMGQKADKE